MTSTVLRNVHCWQDFKSKIANLSTKEKGDAFELLAQYYLQIDPQYKTKLKSVWLLSEVSIELKDKLNLPDQDKGIDIIAETFEGDYWAIQCKYREDEDSSISWDELSTFAGLSFGVCKNISFGLICTTTNRVTDILSRQENIGFCTGEVWRNLDSDFFNQLNSLIEHRPISIKPLSPRSHQIRAIENAKNHFIKEANSRGKMIMPCGTGKSMTAYWIAEELQAKNIIVAVPSLALIRQSLKAWLRESVAYGRKINWICVASDVTVGQIRRDDLTVLKQDLGVPAYTDSDKISEWLELNDDSIKVVFTTYQSGKAISEASKKTKFIFDLGIMDEAHKTVGSKSKLFSHLLFDENIRIKKRLFMTATERRYTGLSDDILSMDDEEIYGDTFEMLTFKDALALTPPILSDYRIVTIAVDKAEVKELIKNNVFVIPDKVKWNEEIEAKTLAANIALQKAFEEYSIKHAVSFHSSISKAKKFRETQSKYLTTFKTEAKLSTYHVNGKISTSIRDKIIKEFESTPPSLITNARCLSEGVDVPNIDCILFADSKKSKIDIVQSIGRALRIYEGKEYAYIIIPILTDANTTTGDLIDDESFNELLTTLRALASNDERIIEYFSSVTKQKGIEGIINIEVNEKIGTGIDSQKFIESIQLRIWNKLAKLSWMPFTQARKFVRKLGLKSQKEWQNYIKGEYKDKPPKPSDIPVGPKNVYKDMGWKGEGDWLGTGTIATQLIEYREFEDAREFVRRLGLTNSKEWVKYAKGEYEEKQPKPSDIPSSPQGTYRNRGWKGYGDWLGTEIIASGLIEYREFEDAREFVRKLNLKRRFDWNKYINGEYKDKPPMPYDIPKAPYYVYKGRGWTGYGDWLGTGTIANYLREYRKFEDARKFVRKLGLKNVDEWRKYIKGDFIDRTTKPFNIPGSPHQIYKDKGWKSWGDWLGTGTVSSQLKEYRKFEDAREFARKLNLKGQKEWYKYKKDEYKDKPLKPPDIPASPHLVYKDKGWKGMQDWLGYKTIARFSKKFRKFEDARKFVRKLGLKSQKEWNKYKKGEYKNKPPKPSDIPSSPQGTYRNRGWKSWGDWLGTGTVAMQLMKYREYEDARKFVKKLGLKGQKEWYKYIKDEYKDKPLKPPDIPANPSRVYKDKGWKGMQDWLGYKTIARFSKKFRKFEDAREFARKLGLKSSREWFKYAKGEFKNKSPKPPDIPASPIHVYKDKGWKGTKDWLGTE